MGAHHLTRFARVDFRSDERVFGIKDEDRLLHLYVIGKTGTGKSTLLENMALQATHNPIVALPPWRKRLATIFLARGEDR